jgi:preprotein translocase subunit SecD
MKTIKYFFIPLLILAFFETTFANQGNIKHTILLQSIDKNVTSAGLDQSAAIITKRLKDYNPGNFDVTVIPEKKQIKVVIADDQDFQTTENLLVHNAIIEFYATYNSDGLLELLNGNNKIFTLLSKSNIGNAGAIIGCTTEPEVVKVNNYLKTLGVEKKCKFAWSQDFDKSSICLYALKTGEGNGPIITGTDVESAVCTQDRITIKLKSIAAGVFAEATKRNLGSALAILLDDKVISAPRVMSEITGGEIEISGRFTKFEAGYIAALINNGILPVSFSVVK